ncbi:MAG: nucleoside monophosphate kinase [Candidatus Wildermuthbacteria bacterium]|nr:nucleoside monophosphate kinase [Candidatus Wildermuthbacteria bacterium]
MKAFKFLAILGRAGSGKGTQAELLGQKFPFKHISTGQLLRDRAENKDFLGKKIADIINAGGLIPTPVTFMLWMPELEALARQTEYRGLLFDGSPRKLHEAEMLNDTLELYGWDKDMRVLNIGISEEEALRRLLKRARSDDDEQSIKNRLAWFTTHVEPTMEYYRKKGLLVDINGEQSVEDVQKEILLKLADFLPNDYS